MKRRRDRQVYRNGRHYHADPSYSRGRYVACQSKRRFVTKRIADRTAEAEGPGLRSYHCRYCGDWHLTQRPLNSDLAREIALLEKHLGMRE